MKARFYAYDKCSTCRNAEKWLGAHDVAFEKIAIVDHPPKAEELRRYAKASGLPLKKFFNTSGLVYRELGLGAKLASMGEDEMLRLLASNGKLIKRPLLIDGAKVLVGFDAKTYGAHFGG
jgi:arsenate reductase